MAVILPFEAPLYEQAGVDVEFVGHPLLDILDQGLTRKKARKRLGIAADDLFIGVLPGSREREVESLLPPLLAAARILAGDFPLARFMIPLASALDRRKVQEYIVQSGLSVEIVPGRAFEVMKAADLLLTASGTATLEAAIAGCPMVIVYRLSLLSALIGWMLIKVKCIGLANIVVGKKVVPELIQGEMTPQRIALEARQILQDSVRRQGIENEFRFIADKLGGKGASHRVARIALQMIETA